MIFILGGLGLLAVLLEVSRRTWNPVEMLFEKYFNSMLRKEEYEGRMTGATWMLFGSTITIFLFPKEVAVAAIIFLSVGDTFTAWIGQLYPVGKIGKKSISGTVAGVISSCLVLLVLPLSISPSLIIFGAIFSMGVELVPLPINDNLTIPLSGAMAIQFGSLIL